MPRLQTENENSADGIAHAKVSCIVADIHAALVVLAVLELNGADVLVKSTVPLVLTIPSDQQRQTLTEKFSIRHCNMRPLVDLLKR